MWRELNRESGSIGEPTPDKEELYEKTKKESLGTFIKEASAAGSGGKRLDPVIFQPVRSPGIYEGEFGVKDDDLLFHFWPDGYNDRTSGGFAPAFPRKFESALRDSFKEAFGAYPLEFANDRDVGAWFVRVSHGGDMPFHRKACILACESLHKALGGAEG